MRRRRPKLLRSWTSYLPYLLFFRTSHTDTTADPGINARLIADALGLVRQDAHPAPRHRHAGEAPDLHGRRSALEMLRGRYGGPQRRDRRPGGHRYGPPWARRGRVSGRRCSRWIAPIKLIVETEDGKVRVVKPVVSRAIAFLEAEMARIETTPSISTQLENLRRIKTASCEPQGHS